MTDAAPTALTDDQIKAAYAEIQAREAAAALVLIKELLALDGFSEVLGKLTSLQPALPAGSRFVSHVNAALAGLNGIRNAAARA